MGKQGIPLSRATIQDYASDIAGKEVGKNWVTRFQVCYLDLACEITFNTFQTHHPDLRVKWTTSLETCRAASLNPHAVHQYFQLLEELITSYQVHPANIYNMDEKGIQLGIGNRTKVLVDRDQKQIYQIESGDRELITITECICADGTTLYPSVVFQGLRRDLRWGLNNPCDARLNPMFVNFIH